MENIDTNGYYSFLAGWLGQTLKDLATDGSFLKLKSDAYRKDYIATLITNAEAAAKSYATKQ